MARRGSDRGLIKMPSINKGALKCKLIHCCPIRTLMDVIEFLMTLTISLSAFFTPEFFINLYLTKRYKLFDMSNTRSWDLFRQ